MGVGAGTGVGGTAQPPQIRETETQAFVENMKKNVLAMLPPDTLEVIPFSQAEYDTQFKYRTEADRPMILPLLHLRMTQAPEYIEEETWQPIYNELVKILPPGLRRRLHVEMLKPFLDRDPGFVALNQMLTEAAKTVAWLEKATQPIEPNSPAEAYALLNAALPFVALRGCISQAETILEVSEAWLHAMGPNYRDHDIIMSFLTKVNESLREINELRKEAEKGNNSPEVKARFIEMANILDGLYKQFQTSGKGNELEILGTTLHSLAVVSAAWAVTSGSPSLLIALSIATTGLETGESGTGVFGEGFSEIVDTIINGFLATVSFGPRAELNEMKDLYNELAQFKDQGGE